MMLAFDFMTSFTEVSQPCYWSCFAASLESRDKKRCR